ncbi:hypothetical protein Tco_0368179 [Tanacetum coccineum]
MNCQLRDYSVVSNSKDSTVNNTEVQSIEDGSGHWFLRESDGPPIMLEDPYAYIVAAYQAPPSLDYMPGFEEP